jgi:hypothetical protein
VVAGGLGAKLIGCLILTENTDGFIHCCWIDEGKSDLGFGMCNFHVDSFD